LTRLADGSDIETRRADAVVSPVLMRLDDVRPLAALYKDAVNARAATALLRVPTPVLRQLAGRELIVRIAGPVARMLGEGDHFRLSSVRGMLLALKERAGKDAAPVGTTRLMDAVRALKPAVPWAAIIAGIAGGDIPVHATKEFGRDWRYAMAVERDRLLAVVGTHRPGPDEAGGSDPWLTRDAAAQVLGTDETTVWAMGREGVLPKRAGDFAMFARADVEAAARQYIFGPEMLQRSTFDDGRQLNAWLRSIGIELALVLRGGQISAFPREAFEAAIRLQPKAPEEDSPPPRERRRVSPADKQRAIEAVTSGLSTYYVGKRMGIHHKSIAKWVKHFRETGKIEPAGKLDPHAGRIAAMIEADPSRSTYALWADFKENGGIDVAYTSFARFVAEIGFARDPATNRLERSS
jgi:transposase-like protein